MKLKETLVYIFRHPIILVKQLTFWSLCLLFLLLVILIDEGTQAMVSFISDGLLIVLILTVMTSFRAARGNLKGMARIQIAWMNWYDQIKMMESVERTHQKPPFSGNEQGNSIFNSLINTLKTVVRHPRSFFIHFVFWSLLFGAGIYLDDPMQNSISVGSSLNHEFLSEYLEGFPILLILTFLTNFLEAQGFMKGIATAQKTWLEWYNRYYQTNYEKDISEKPPVLMTDRSMDLFTFHSLERVIMEPVFFILAYMLCTTLLSWIGIVDNPNFFIKYLSFAVWFAV